MSERAGCMVADCDGKHYAKSLCEKHYQRQKRNGTTDLVGHKYAEPKPCSVSDCDRRAKTRGMCGMHAERARAGTKIEGPKRTAKKVPFEERYTKDESGCWTWIAGTSTSGYGAIAYTYAHRYSYELHVGPIPEGMVIDHLCRNTLCVNPAHLEAVPPRINMLRGVAPAALAVQNDRCKRGHKFTPDNTYTRRDGTRNCRKCRAIYLRERSNAAA